MSTYKKFVRMLRGKWQVEELPESPLLRSDDGYFTFSPFQDTEENFDSLKSASSIFVKYQPTIRKLNALDLTNPLNLNYQTTANFPGFYNSMSKKPTITAFFEV